MLRKVIRIRNIGKFRKFDAAGDVEFRPLTLIFAENARGKTTLCDILRSLKTNSPDYICGRHTLDSSEDSEVKILFEDGVVTYQNGTWSESHPEIEIFDTTFVHENVYAGDYVDHEHKRNLYRVIVGEEGVHLARKVDELDKKIRESDSVISERRSDLKALIPESISIDTFLELSDDERIDERIRDAETEIEAVDRADEIHRKSELESIQLPELPSDFVQLLSTKLEDITLQAETIVRTHLAQKTHRARETWLSEGLGYIRDNNCPFCGQSLDSSDIIQHYRTYFGQSYKGLMSRVESLRQRVELMYSEGTTFRIKQIVSRNQDLFEFWLQFVSLEPLVLDLDQIIEALKGFTDCALNLIKKKLGLILEPVQLGTSFSEKQSQFEDAKSQVRTYNERVAAINALIRAKKSEIQKADLSELKSKLKRLSATKIRYEEEGKSACEQYQAALDEKKQLQEEKNQAKDQLDTYSSLVLQKFENRINRLLEIFGASFRIGDTRRQYLGGRPSSTYQVVINGIGVELGDSSTNISKPCFRNTLSAGDRSTLALAFFIAKLELDPDLDSKILFLDDPFSSQDRSRSTCTQQQICRLSEKCKQTIVLSHEPKFLRRIWDAVERSRVRSLQLTRIGENSTVNPWDIEDDTRGDYFQKLSILKAFTDEGTGDPRQVAQTIRPVLEEYLRFNWPGKFQDTEWLGDFLTKIEDADEGNPLHSLKDTLPELEDINDYSKRYHHSQTPGADVEPIDNGELTTFVKRTLSLVSAY